MRKALYMYSYASNSNVFKIHGEITSYLLPWLWVDNDTASCVFALCFYNQHTWIIVFEGSLQAPCKNVYLICICNPVYFCLVDIEIKKNWTGRFNKHENSCYCEVLPFFNSLWSRTISDIRKNGKHLTFSAYHLAFVLCT